MQALGDTLTVRGSRYVIVGKAGHVTRLRRVFDGSDWLATGRTVHRFSTLYRIADRDHLGMVRDLG